MFRRKLIFLSYSGDPTQIEEIANMLKRRRYAVYFDRWLQPLPFDLGMKAAVRRCSLFVLFVSPESLRPGSACLNELSYLERRYPDDPSAAVLLIDQRRTEDGDLPKRPPYIHGLQVYKPHGNFVLGTCDAIQERRPPGIDWSLRRFGIVLTWAVVLGLSIFSAIAHYERTGTPLTLDQRVGLVVLVPLTVLIVALVVNGVWYALAKLHR